MDSSMNWDKLEEDDEEKNKSYVEKNETKPSKENKVKDEHLKNFVTIDSIRKQVNRCEQKLMKKWPEKYGCLSGEFLKAMIDEEYVKKKLITKELESRMRSHSIMLTKNLPHVPVTSSAVIGWKLSNSIYDLESTHFKYVPLKHHTEPSLSNEKQYFLFLG